MIAVLSRDFEFSGRKQVSWCVNDSLMTEVKEFDGLGERAQPQEEVQRFHGTRMGDGMDVLLARFRREVCEGDEDEDEDEWRLCDDLEEEEPGSRFLDRLRPKVVKVGTVEISRMLIVLISVTIECEWLDSLRLLPLVRDEEPDVQVRSGCWLEESGAVEQDEDEDEDEGKDEGFLRLK